VITIAGSAAVMFAEICCKGSVILTLGRALLVILQGIWFIQIGYILFKGMFSHLLAQYTDTWGSPRHRILRYTLHATVSDVASIADLPAWDPHSMNSVMMAPALYCLDIMLLTLGALIGAAFGLRCCDWIALSWWCWLSSARMDLCRSVPASAARVWEGVQIHTAGTR